MTTTPLPIAAAPQAPPDRPTMQPALRGHALLRLGFRPFYLGAAAFACVALPLWMAMLFGGLRLPMPLPPLLWHAHEMIYGFAVAVIVGFLLTAGKAWTGLATPRGAFLGALAGLWLAARIAAVAAPHALYATLDLLLLPVIAGVLLRILLRARNRRNLPLVGLLALLAAANLGFHLAAAGLVDFSPLRALHAGLALIVMIECVMAGRVVPAFTSAATPGLQLKARPRVEQVTLALTALALLSWVLPSPAWLGVTACTLAGLAHAARQWTWQPAVTRHRPILWVLHAAYAWLWTGLLLLAAAHAGWVCGSAAVHALGVGATGGLIIGMVTRTARGHTGRALKVSRPEVWAYSLVMLAAALRVLLPLAAPQWLAPALLAASLAWSAAFALYLGVYTPWLMSTRLDGKDG